MGFEAGSLIPEGGSPGRLGLVAEKSHFGIVEQLFRKGSSINIRDQYNNTLLYCAARDGILDAVRLLAVKVLQLKP